MADVCGDAVGDHAALHLHLLLLEALLSLHPVSVRDDRQASPVSRGSYEIVNRALALLFRTRDRLTLDEVARRIGVNRTTFSECFRKRRFRVCVGIFH